MGKNESVNFFLRFLNERFDEFRKSLSDLLLAVAQEDREQKLVKAQAALSSLNDLKRAMSEQDHPRWLATLEGRLQWYLRHFKHAPDAGLQLLQTVMALYTQIENQTWNFTESVSDAAIDFSATYQEYYQQSRVPELFDNLVAQLESVIDSGEIDSLRAIKALKKLISTIKKNARGDYFSTRGAWEFTQVFFKNYALEVLESIPALAQAVKAMRSTISELDIEFSQVHKQVQTRLSASVNDELPMLRYGPVLLPAPKTEGKGIT